MSYCGCGCGHHTNRRFVPGHDARHKGNLLRNLATTGSIPAFEELLENGWLKLGLFDLADARFGVEIECIVPSQPTQTRDDTLTQLADSIATLTGLPVNYRGYTHAVTAEWKVVTDASITTSSHSGLYVGAEIVSPILTGKLGMIQLMRIMRALRQLGAKINQSCGLHVHHDLTAIPNMPEFTTAYCNTAVVAYSAAAFYYEAKSKLRNVLPRSRWNNSMCAGQNPTGFINNMNRAETFGNNPIAADSDLRYHSSYADRYVAVNFAAYCRYKTIEFRQHSGTLDSLKACAWILTTFGILWHRAFGATQQTAQAGMLSTILYSLIPTNFVKYYRFRRTELEPTNSATRPGNYQSYTQQQATSAAIPY